MTARLAASIRALALLFLALLALVFAAGLAVAWPRAGEPSAVEVELAGTSNELGRRLGDGCAPWPQDSAACLEAAASARDAVRRDLWFVGAYVVSVGVLCWLGARTAAGRRRTRRFLNAAGAGAVAAPASRCVPYQSSAPATGADMPCWAAAARSA